MLGKHRRKHACDNISNLLDERPRSSSTHSRIRLGWTRLIMSKAELQGRLGQARRICADDPTEGRIVDVAVEGARIVLNISRRTKPGKTVRAGGTYLPPPLAAALEAQSGSPAPSQREIEVLELMARGLSNKQIAYELDITETNAKNHAQIFR